ncbi:addiction module toxin RelE [Salicibibacter cibi]|uniref:Addiction module toxin RelE n=1 Tax=Salicibibacter cibi TaxID=2743001 RepID=A0A7T7CE46_9BACI|nr:hypothetical protein [Salicibibacter cibi]QQK78678.1 addiction module toxin RelE [Salicibibacter cibi]
MFEVYVIAEAAKEYDRLAGNEKQWVDAAIQKLKERGEGIGEPLGNTKYARLQTYKKVKHRKLGLRMIFREEKQQTNVITVIAIGKRTDEKIYKDAHKRL